MPDGVTRHAMNVRSSGRTDPNEGPWPTFALECAFNPRDASLPAEFDPDEVVIFERAREPAGGRWISGKRGSFVSLDETR